MTEISNIDLLLKAFFIFCIINFIKYNSLTKPKIRENNEIITPKVSVFLPIYNREKYLIRSINSIQKQTLKEIEIVAVNDCSTDNSLKILKQLAKNDSRIKIINNDRNHGLLYSRAMGILNCTGEYVLNLDPDDQFQGINNLEILYRVAKFKNTDMVIYLLEKHQPWKPYNPGNNSLVSEVNPDNSSYITTKRKKRIDYLITNKLIRREIILKVYEEISYKIYSNKWNYHEDKLWCYTLHKLTNKITYVDRVMYIYLLNWGSLMKHRANSLEIKNIFYKEEALDNVYGRTQWRCNYFFYLINGWYRNIIKADRDLRKRIIRRLISFYKNFDKNKSWILNKIKNTINKLSNKKIIIFNKSFKENLNNNLVYLTIFKFLGIITKKKIIYIDANIDRNVNDIMKFVFPDDILVGIDDVFFQPKFNSLVKNCPKNKIVLFIQNIQNITFNYKDLALNNHPDHSVFSMNLNSYELFQKKLNYKELYYIPDYIINWSNFFNYKINFVKNNNTLILIENSTNEMNENKIKKMVSKYISNITYNIINITKLSEQNYKDSIIDTIKEYKYIITDNIYIMKLSAIYSTSCVVMEKNQTKEMNDIFKNLDYIKYIHDIKDLEKNLIELINITSLNFNYTKIYNQYYDKIISEFR